MSGGLKCNPFSVALVTIGTLIVVACMFIFVIVNAPLGFDTCESENEDEETEIIRYGIVIRVEDSPTVRPELFSWSYDVNRTLDRVETVQYSCQPGDAAGTGIQKFLVSCLDEISKVVPKDQHEGTVVFLLAQTAAIEDPRQLLILEDIRDAIAQYSFNTSQASLDEPTAVTPDDIARYRWIAENEVLGSIRSEVSESNGDSPDTPDATRGILDIRTDSARITFALPDGEDITETPEEKVELLRLYSGEYRVYTQSYPCYGLQEADRRFKEQLLTERLNSSVDSIPNPCAPSGYSETTSLSLVRRGSSCVTQAPPADRKPAASFVDTKVSKQSDETKYTLEGVGDPVGCQRQVEKLVQDGEFSPVPQGDFVAFFPTLPFDVADLSSLDTSSEVYCDWANKSIEAFSKEINATNMNSCFVMKYLNALTVAGFNIDQETWDRTIIIEDENTAEPDAGWVHGFMTSAVNGLPPPPGPCVVSEENRLIMERRQRAITAVIVLILSGLIIVGLGYGIACRRGSDNWVPSPLAMYQFEEK